MRNFSRPHLRAFFLWSLRSKWLFKAYWDHTRLHAPISETYSRCNPSYCFIYMCNILYMYYMPTDIFSIFSISFLCNSLRWLISFITYELGYIFSTGYCESETFRYAIVILIYEFTISEVIELVRTRDHIEDITEGLFLTLTYVALCFKYGNFLARRDEVSTLLNCFRGETCQPKNSEERMILIKYDRKGSQTGILSFLFFHCNDRLFWRLFLKIASKFHI